MRTISNKWYDFRSLVCDVVFSASLQKDGASTQIPAVKKKGKK